MSDSIGVSPKTVLLLKNTRRHDGTNPRLGQGGEATTETSQRFGVHREKTLRFVPSRPEVGEMVV